MKKGWLYFLFFLAVAVFFFWPVFLKGWLPFPGDLLTAEYAPWSTYSYLGYLPGSIPHKAQYFDTLKQLYPWKTLSLNILKKGNWPLWNPYNFSGTPLMANFQSAVFYPLNIFYFLLPQIEAWTLLVVLQPLLAGFFTYLFARQIGLKRPGAFLAAIAFSYSGFMTVFLEYNIIGQTILWLPLAGFFFEKLLKKETFWRFFLFSLSLAIPFLAGHFPSAVLLFVFVGLYILFRLWSQSWSWKKKIKLGLKIVVLMTFSLGLATVQLMSSGELISRAARTPHDYHFLVDKLLIQPKQLIMLLVPDFFGNPATRNYWLKDTYVGKVTYIGLIPFVFSIFAFSLLKKNNLIRFFSLVTVVIFGLMVAWPLTRFLYQFKIPLISTSSPGNAIFLASFSMACLAGFGLDKWFEEKKKKKRLIFSGLLLIFLLLWFQPASRRNLLYSSGVLFIFMLTLGLTFFKRKRNLVIILIILISIGDLFYFFRKFNPFVPQALVFPQAEVLSWLEENGGFNRFWGYGMARIEPNFASQYQLFSPDGYDPLYIGRYGELAYASQEGKILKAFDNQTRSDAVIVPGFGETDLVTNPYREKMLSLLGVKYILDRVANTSTERTFPNDCYQLVWESQGWRIFENLLAAPRAFLVSDYLIFEKKEDFEKIFFAPDFKIQKTILLEKEPQLRPKPAGLAEVEIISYQPNQVSLQTDADANQLLFLSDNDYPGWRAFIDNQPTKIYRANYAFRAVSVPKGKHQVLFRYQPKSFVWGAKISLVSLILILVFSFL